MTCLACGDGIIKLLTFLKPVPGQKKPTLARDWLIHSPRIRADWGLIPYLYGKDHLFACSSTDALLLEDSDAIKGCPLPSNFHIRAGIRRDMV